MLRQLLNQFVEKQPLDDAPEVDLLQLSTCALLVEVAMIDGEFDATEQAHILEALSRRFSLSAPDAEELLALASEARDTSSDIWKFTNALNTTCTADEKMQAMEEVWRIVYADGHLDGHEDNLAHKMGLLLNLPHPNVIEAKVRARETPPA